MNDVRFNNEDELKLLISVFSLYLFLGIVFDSIIFIFIYVLILLVWSILFNLYAKPRFVKA